MEGTLKRKYCDEDCGPRKKPTIQRETPRLPLDLVVKIAQSFDLFTLVQSLQIDKQWYQLKYINHLWDKPYRYAIFSSRKLESYWVDGVPNTKELQRYFLTGEPLFQGTGSYQENILLRENHLLGSSSLIYVGLEHDKSEVPFERPYTWTDQLVDFDHSKDYYYYYPPPPTTPLTWEKLKMLSLKRNTNWRTFVHEVLAWFDTDDMLFFVDTIQPIYVTGTLEETLTQLVQKSDTWRRMVFLTLEALVLSRDVYSVVDEHETLLNEDEKTIDIPYVSDDILWKQFGKFYVSLKRFSKLKIVNTYQALYHKFFKDYPFSMLGYSLILCDENSSVVDHWSNHVGKCDSEPFEDDLPLRLSLSRGIQRLAFRAGIKKSEPDTIEMGINSLKDFLESLMGDIIKIHDMVKTGTNEEIDVKEVLAALEIGGRYDGTYGPSKRLPQVLFGFSENEILEDEEKDDESEFIPEITLQKKDRSIQPQQEVTMDSNDLEYQAIKNEEKGNDQSNGDVDSHLIDLEVEGPEYGMELEEVSSFLKEIGWDPQHPDIQDESLYGKLLRVSQKVHEMYGKPLFESSEDLNNNLPMFAKNWVFGTGSTEKWVPIKNRNVDFKVLNDNEKEETILEAIKQEDLEHFGEDFFDKQETALQTEEEKFLQELRRRTDQTISDHFEQLRIGSVLHKHFPGLSHDSLASLHISSTPKEEETPKIPSLHISQEKVIKEDLVFEKENFRDLCFSILQSNGDFDIQNSAMDILQRSGEELILKLMRDMNTISSHNLTVTLQQKDLCLVRRLTDK